MESNVRKKQNVLLVFGLLILIVSISGIAFAFFNYTRTGSSNTLRLGSIEFSSNYTSVTLQNIFPVDSNDIGNDTDNVATVTINVNGKTTYENGIEYLVTLTDVNNIGGNSVIPITLNVSVSSGLGTSDNSYFTNRGSTTKLYKVLADTTVYNGEYVVVGYIPNSDVTTSGTITLKAYIDDDSIAISDTYDGSESYKMGTTSNWVDGRTVITTDAWNSAIVEGLSFKIKVEANEGTWVNEPENFYDLIEGKATSAPTYVKSYTTSVINNNHSTFTTQDTVGTNNNKEEVYYYTGSDAIANGNVLFAGYCWQIVRTTDNGGVRLIYNGMADNNQCTTARSSNTYLGVKGTNENISLSSAYLYGDSYDYDLATGKFHLVNHEGSTRTWTKATYESFLGKYTCKNATGTNCDNVWYVGEYLWNDDTKVETTKYSIENIDNYREMGSSSFNAGYSSPANVGYMYNKIYNAKSGVTTGAIYGKDIEYSNGNYLVIETTSGVASTNTTIDEYHHYSCGTLDTNDDPVTTCDVVRYYYVSYEGTYYYIELTGGETVEDALKNMINYKQVDDNVDADINVISSSMKDYLEIWYDKNLKAYEGYLDTNAVYCNNRTITGLGGWEKTGGTYPSNWLKFKQYSVNLDLACANELDRFSKENRKARIKNPIGLITEPERGLMGADYAATESIYWGLSPSYFSSGYAFERYVDATGAAYNVNVYNARGVRAAITLAPDTVILGGAGLATDPYQVGPLVTR